MTIAKDAVRSLPSLETPTLTKAELAELLFERLGLNKRESKDMVEAFFEMVHTTLVKASDVKLSGFGNFNIRRKAPRPGRNPRTGEAIPIKARHVVTFHASHKLKSNRAGRHAGRRRVRVKSELSHATSLISMEKALPAIPAKRYFTIGEVSDLCGVKPYVLRYWEQEFTQLKPMKRRGNRRYYQHHEVLLIRRIRELLYDQGFTISGARNRLAEHGAGAGAAAGAMAMRCCGTKCSRSRPRPKPSVDAQPAAEELPVPEVTELST